METLASSSGHSSRWNIGPNEAYSAFAQQFTLSADAKIQQLEVDVGSVSSPSWRISIRSSLQGSAIENTEVTGNDADITVSLSEEPILEAGTYWLVTEVLSGYMSLGFTAGIYIPGDQQGETYTYKVSTSSWVLQDMDQEFYVRGEWYTAPEKATSPSPADSAYGVSLNLASLTWEHASDDVTFDVYFKKSAGEAFGSYEKIASGISAKSITLLDVIDYENVFPASGKIAPLEYGEQYGAGEGHYWRVDVSDGENTTPGDVWSFSTLAFNPPVPDGMGYDKDTEELVETTGLTGKNAMVTLRKLVAFAKNSVFYES